MSNNITENLNINQQENLNSNEKNVLNIQNYFENSINISEIENKENEDTKKENLNQDKNINNLSNSSIILDDQSIHQLNKDIDLNNNNIKKKLTKEDLNNIPLPIFSCIYCSNDYLSFNHLSNEILLSKYFNLTSVYDMKNLDKLIQYQPLIDQDHKNHPLLDIIVKNTDYLNNYYSKEDSINFYNSQKFKILYISNNLKIKKFFLQRLEDCIIRKKNKDLTNKKLNNNNRFNNKNLSYKLSFHNNSTTNDNLNNVIGNNKNNNNTFGTGTCAGTGSYSSLNNIISFSLNNNENNNNILCLNNLNMMENIMEKIEKNTESGNDDEGGEEFLNFFGNESHVHKKINKNKISFEDKAYNIWDPTITIIDENENNNKDKNFNLKEVINKIYNYNYCKNNLSDDINNNNMEKSDKNTQKIFSDRRIREFKKLLSYSQTTNIQNKMVVNINTNKKLSKINIKKNGPSETNIDFFKNNENLNNNNYYNTKNNFNNNLFQFKSVYLNKNKKNQNNNNKNIYDSKNILSLLNNRGTTNLDNESFSQTKELNKGKMNENEKGKKKENNKLKNMTININNNGPKNLLFLLKYPKTTSHSNKINQKMLNININSPKINCKPLSSFKKNIINENYIVFKHQENSTSRKKSSIDKNLNNIIHYDFYDNNLRIYNSRNYINKRREILNDRNNENIIKGKSALMNDENLRNRSGYSSCTHLQINLSKIFHRNKSKEKINEIMKKIFKKNHNNYKININDFVHPNKKVIDIKNNIKKLNNNIKIPLLNKRSISVSRHLMQKKGMNKMKL